MSDSGVVSDSSSNAVPDGVLRATSLWAFSEGYLGGLLHLFKIPFKGIFLSGIAIFSINLIHLFAQGEKRIFRSMLEVEIIKAGISPHSPPNAYFAVFVEGSMGEILFGVVKSRRVASLLLGMFSGLYSAFQRIVVLTVLFGVALWQSINTFTAYIIGLFGGVSPFPFNASFWLIAAYGLVHLIIGTYFGWSAARFASIVKRASEQSLGTTAKVKREEDYLLGGAKKKMRLSTKLLLGFLFAVFLFSYINPHWRDNLFLEVAIMLLRAIIITALWKIVLSPLSERLLSRLIRKGKSKYWNELEEITALLPSFESALGVAKEESKAFKGVKRLSVFVKYFFAAAFAEGKQ
jgi:hypothetical protein